ncbi:MAG TPA: hypothetical protein VK789_31125 [Bryobacteraceae bacterium]|nr:hypothetical protein [Bryobacteraceae bacterium]
MALRTWLVRVYNGLDPETRQRKHLNQTIHGDCGKPTEAVVDENVLMWAADPPLASPECPASYPRAG